jgi:2'-5' RNA ligase
MHRLFVALRPRISLRRHLLDCMGGVPGARWQSEDQLHLTLRFIGPVERPHAEEIAAVLDTVDRPRPTLTLRGAGIFGRAGRAQTLWAGIAPDDGLSRLHDRIERALQRVGVPPDRRAFLPHITLARFGAGTTPIGVLPEKLAALASMPCEVDAFSLYESSLGRDGAAYSVVEHYRLT